MTRSNFGTVLAIACGIGLLWFGLGLSATAQSMHDIVIDSEGGMIPNPSPTIIVPIPGLEVVILGGWSQSGQYLGIKAFDSAEECEAARSSDIERYPTLAFSSCIVLTGIRQTF